MAIQVHCKACDTSYMVKDQWAGKRLRCRLCKEPVDVPAVGAARTATASTTQTTGGDADDSASGLDALFGESSPETHTPHDIWDLAAAYAAVQKRVVPRPNRPFVYPGSTLVDGILPWLVIIGGLGFLIQQSIQWATAQKAPILAGAQATLLVLIGLAVGVPLALKGISWAAREFRFILPADTTRRMLACVMPPLVFGVVAYYHNGFGYFILGTAVGLLVSGVLVCLLFHLQPIELLLATLGAGGAFLATLLVVGYGVSLMSYLEPLMLPADPVAKQTPPTGPASTPGAAPGTATATAEGPSATGQPADPQASAGAGSNGAAAAGAVGAGGTGGSTSPNLTTPGANPPGTTPPTPDAAAAGGNVPPTEAATPPPAPVEVASVNVPERPLPVEPTPPTEAESPIITEDFTRVLFPQTTTQFMAVIRTEPARQVVELWETSPPRKVSEAVFPGETNPRVQLALSPDGRLVARLTDFPRWAINVYSFADNKVVNTIDLQQINQAEPTLVGFLSPKELVMVYSNRQNGMYGAEKLDATQARRPAAAPVRAMAPAENGLSLSPAGRHLLIVSPMQSQQLTGPMMTKHRIGLYDFRMGPPLFAVEDPPGTDSLRILGMAWTPDGRRFALATEVNRGVVIMVYAISGSTGRLEGKVALPPGALLAPVVTGALDWIPDSDHLLLFGDAIVDISSGAIVSQNGATNVRDQRVIDKDRAFVVRNANGKNTLENMPLAPAQ